MEQVSMIAVATGEMSNPAVSTVALSIAAGGILMVLAKRLRMPGIVLLLLGGVLLGPEVLGVVQPDALGGVLNVLVAVAVGLILFEGGLTLDVGGYRTAPRVIRNLLTIGVAVTWLGTALAIWGIFGVDPVFAVLAASLVVVTGPTVIQPILKRIRLKWNLHSILHWEGVLIDPIGVFLAILAFEWVVGGAGDTAFLHLLIRIVGGLAIGYLGGELLAYILKRKWIPEDLLHVFMVGCATGIFGLTEALISEGGLLSVTLAGLICGSRQPPALKAIVEFKSIIVDLLIGFVFILLTARLELRQFVEFGERGFALVAIVILVVRPVSVWLCTMGQGMPWRERAFLGWVAPRGVVAASMASLFALTLAEQGRFGNTEFIETFVYSVIFTTVLLQGFTAGPLAWALRLQAPQPTGWLIVGAHPVAREVAKYLGQRRQVPVVLIDGNRRAVKEARDAGLVALYGDARETARLEGMDELQGLGRLLAFTDNEDLNELLCKKWEAVYGSGHVYRWATAATVEGDSESTGTVLWSWMPKPSMLSTELELGEAALVEMEGERMKNPGGLAALMTAHAGEVLLDPGPESKLKGGGKGVAVYTLYLQREADYLLNAMHPSWILRSATTDKGELIYQMARRLAETDPRMAADDIYAQVMEFEATTPTTLGHGIAVPHLRVAGLERSVCMLAQVPNGIVGYGAEAEPVRLVFLLLSPLEAPEMHLAVLGEIARMCAEPQFRAQLLECADLAEILPLVRRYRRQHTAFADARG